MIKNNQSKTINSKAVNFINFLKNEFGLEKIESIKKTERKIVQKISKSTVNTKENFHKIGRLIDDALKHLPDVENTIGDNDDIQSKNWQKLHKETKNILQIQKKDKPHTDILFTGSGGNKKINTAYSYNLKTLTLALFLLSIILMNCFLCIKPSAGIKLLAYTDNILNPKTHTSKRMATNINNLGLSKDKINTAKVQFILQNQDKIQNKNKIGVTAKDLFGLNADAGEIDNNYDYIQPKENKIDLLVNTIKISWLNFFKELFSK